MLRRPVSGLAGIVVLFSLATAARAQEFRVYTQIFDARHAAGGRSGAHPHPRGRSTSLFHAGQIYDRIDGGNQMTIYEPAHEQFVIVDAARRQSAVLSFEDINRWIYQAEASARDFIAKAQADKSQAERIAFTRFQLAPQFKESYDEKDKLLTLGSKWLTYEVKCATHDPDFVKAYLDYADWMARLNYVVYPQTLFPGPRLALDEALRRRGLLPVEVTLRSASQTGMQLRAEHRFDWKLDATDLRTIHDWDALLQDRTIKQVAPETFLATLAAAKPQDRK